MNHWRALKDEERQKRETERKREQDRRDSQRRNQERKRLTELYLASIKRLTNGKAP